jgi:hypothetical protein
LALLGHFVRYEGLPKGIKGPKVRGYIKVVGGGRRLIVGDRVEVRTAYPVIFPGQQMSEAFVSFPNRIVLID